MAIPATNIWECETGGSDTLNGGGFDPGNANMSNGWSVASANTATPVLTHSSLNSASGDINNSFYLKSGTSSISGWYKIASQNGTGWNLSAAIGAAVLSANNVPSGLNTVAGCGTTGSLTTITGTIDYSQQGGVQFSLTGLTTAAANAIILTASATVAMVGNGLQITGGTNFTTGFYSISSVSAGVSLTVDRNCTSAAGAAGTAGLGGALASLVQLSSVMANSNSAYLQGETGYTQTATATFAQSVVPSNTVAQNRLTGYTSLRTDGGQATVTLATNTGLIAVSITGNGWTIQGLIINCASLGTSTGIKIAQQYCTVRFCKVLNFTLKGIQITSSQSALWRNEVTGGTAAATAAISSESPEIVILWNTVHDNACTGIAASLATNPSQINNNLVYNNTGASSDGIFFGGLYGLTINGNVCYGNGRHGISQLNSYLMGGTILNNLLVNNGGYGIKGAAASGNPNDANYDGNAFYGNTSGTRNNMGIGLIDVILTGNPFTNAAGGDFSLNNTAGAGAACRAAGFPGVFPGGTTTGYLDMGAAQSQASGGGLIYLAGMTGGME